MKLDTVLAPVEEAACDTAGQYGPGRRNGPEPN